MVLNASVAHLAATQYVPSELCWGSTTFFTFLYFRLITSKFLFIPMWDKSSKHLDRENHSAWVLSWWREFSGWPLTEFWWHILSGFQVCNWGISVPPVQYRFEWRRISTISDSSLIDHTGTANDFITKVNQNPPRKLISQEVVTPRSVVSALISSTVLNAAKIMKKEGYLLPTIARKITCRRFDWMLQSSSGRTWRRCEQNITSYL